MGRVFPSFNQSGGAVCPICEKSDDGPTILVPIPGTEQQNIMKAHQMHEFCARVVCTAYLEKD